MRLWCLPGTVKQHSRRGMKHGVVCGMDRGLRGVSRRQMCRLMEGTAQPLPIGSPHVASRSQPVPQDIAEEIGLLRASRRIDSHSLDMLAMFQHQVEADIR